MCFLLLQKILPDTQIQIGSRGVLPLLILEIYQTWWPSLNLKALNKKNDGTFTISN